MGGAGSKKRTRICHSDRYHYTCLISKQKKPNTLEENKRVAARGGSIIGNTRKEIESNIGKSIVSPLNAKNKELPNNPVES